MDVSGQINTAVAILLGEETPVLRMYSSGWIPEYIRTCCDREGTNLLTRSDF